MDNHTNPLLLTAEEAESLIDQAIYQMLFQMKPSRYRSWAKLACAISFLTGRRVYEVCVTGEFTVINKSTLQMTGRAKIQDKNKDKPQAFHVLSDAYKIYAAIEVLRSVKDFEIHKGKAYESFGKSCNTALRNALIPNKKTAKPFFTGFKISKVKLTPNALRQLYAAIYRYQLKQDKPNLAAEDYERLIGESLGYEAKTDVITRKHYQEIVITNKYFSEEYPLDADGNNGEHETQSRIDI